MKKVFLVLAVFALIALTNSRALAATSTFNPPTGLTYAVEWINLNLFTWKSQSKVKVMNEYAQKRVTEIADAVSAKRADTAINLANRFQAIEQKLNALLQQKNISNKSELVGQIKTSQLEQQKTLSETRQNLAADATRDGITSVQVASANQTRATVSQTVSQEAAKDFSDKVVSIWRDPQNSMSESAATRVYADTTATATDNANDGVIIDGGEGKITQDGSGNLNIVYAPGTGPDSTIANDGRAIWKIQMSDGTVIDSYTTASRVVIGQVTGVASNIVVNTVNGTTTGATNVVAGGTSGGNASVGRVVVGGKANTVSQQSDGSSTSGGSGQTVVNGTNSSNSLNSGDTLNNTEGTPGSGGASQTIATPIPQQGQQ